VSGGGGNVPHFAAVAVSRCRRCISAPWHQGPARPGRAEPLCRTYQYCGRRSSLIPTSYTTHIDQCVRSQSHCINDTDLLPSALSALLPIQHKIIIHNHSPSYLSISYVVLFASTSIVMINTCYILTLFLVK